MKVPPVKYMRDFYPEDMRLRNWIEASWRQASLRSGFQEWDAPIVEHLDLYRRKSGDEIVEQLYTIRTKGGDDLAIRPEMTPSLARMIALRQSALPRPVKWFCVARMCRYERGQRGRLREFWQWNVDVLGVADVLADAEVINVALDGLRILGLGADDIETRINSRRFLASALSAIGVPAERHDAVYAVTDKRGKIPDEELHKKYAELALPDRSTGLLGDLMRCESLADVVEFAAANGVTGHEPALDELHRLMDYLDALGKREYCRFDIGVVRGLAYYTGPVFEIFDKRVNLRALCGGGRYDHLMESMGGQAMPAAGFGLGDVVLGELLKELGKTPGREQRIEFHLIPLEEERFGDALRLAQRLRDAGRSADCAMKVGGLGKAMKRAADDGAAHVGFVGGQEWDANRIRLRDLKTGAEREIEIDQLVSSA